MGKGANVLGLFCQWVQELMFNSCFCQWVQDKRDLSIMFQIKGLKKK